MVSMSIDGLAYTNSNSVAKKIFVPYKVQGSKVVPLVAQDKIDNYMKGINALDNYFSNNPLPSGLDLDKIDWHILDTSGKFAKFYKALGTTRSEAYIKKNVAGFNSLNLGTGKTTIGLNPELQSDKSGESNFGTEDRYAETAIHEFAHSLHRAISLDFGKKDSVSKRKEFNEDYVEIAKQEVSWYAKQDYMEHFSEAFSKYLSTGEATPEFKQFLQKYIHTGSALNNTPESNESDENYVDAELTKLPRLDPDFTSDERKALRTYTSVENGRHNEINTYLRTGKWVDRAANDEEEQQRLLGVIESLKNMINETSLPQNTKLVRYQRTLPPGMDQVGAVWTSDGFLSTAAITADGLPVVNSFTGLPFEIEIKAPKGSKAGAIIGSFEGEVLLPPGSKFLVESVENQGLKSVKIQLKLIEQNDTNPVENLRTVETGFENWIPEVFNILESFDLEEDPVDERGNKVQSVFLEKAGFNGKPKVISQEEFDATESETIYRAVSSESFVDDFLNSPTQYAGEGSFGNGTYSTNKKETTESFAGDTSNNKDTINSRTIEMKLAPDANVLSFEEVSEMREWASKKADEFLSRYIKAGANPRQAQEFDWQLANDSGWTNLAIMSGIDAVRFKVPMTQNDEYYTIILNRGKVIVNGKS